MNKIKKAAFEAAVKAAHEETKKIEEIAKGIFDLSVGSSFNTVKDSTIDCDASEIFATIANIANEMALTGKYVAIHLTYADFNFENKQVRFFLVLSNVAGKGRSGRNNVHIEVWHADSDKPLAYPKYQQTSEEGWTVIGGDPFTCFIE